MYVCMSMYVCKCMYVCEARRCGRGINLRLKEWIDSNFEELSLVLDENALRKISSAHPGQWASLSAELGLVCQQEIGKEFASPHMQILEELVSAEMNTCFNEWVKSGVLVDADSSRTIYHIIYEYSSSYSIYIYIRYVILYWTVFYYMMLHY